MVWGIATSLGCYLNAIVTGEVTLCVAGLRTLSPRAARRWVSPAGVALFALFDLYTLHMVALPCYTGFIAHRPGGGAVASFHPATASFAALVVLWIFYAAATLGLVVLARAAWRRMIAVIGDSGNQASIGLHERFGFRLAGTLHAVGFKFGRWVDTVLMGCLTVLGLRVAYAPQPETPQVRSAPKTVKHPS
jgi:hypothetical protein